MSEPCLTRRGLVTAAGATLAGMGIPLAAEAGILVSDLDAELFALLDRWREARAAWDATDVPLDEAQTRAKAAYPPMPKELWSTLDFRYHLDAEASGRGVGPSGRLGSFYRFHDVVKLRKSLPVTRWAIADDSADPPSREPDPAGEARRQEIIAVSDRWEAERKAVEDAAGYTALSEQAETLATAWAAVDDALFACQPRTVPGLARKGAWVAACLSKGIGRDDLGVTFARQVAAFGGVTA